MSLADRIAWLEEQIGSNPPDPDPEETRRQAARDLEEIGRLGLDVRATDEFASRLPDAIPCERRIGYFMTKDTVWCDTRYTLPGGTDVLQKEFGFRRSADGPWELIWDEPGMVDEP